jgi:hypothetical protein
MKELPRHQCFLYAGSPVEHLPALAVALRDKLRDNYRCLYLHSPPMVSGMRSCLRAIDVDVAQEEAKTSLVLSSERRLAPDGSFDPDIMLDLLEETLEQAEADGYKGLFATGDMAWEFGPRKDFAKLVDYERRLEQFFHTHSGLCGICQYDRDVLPQEAVQAGLLTHSAVFVNQTLSRINPYFLERGETSPIAAQDLDGAVDMLYRLGGED